jgi:hypothetical protein
MSEERYIDQQQEVRPRRRRGPGVVWAVILIAIGLAFLLNNLGVIAIDWARLWVYWPVILILVGVDLLVGRRSLLGGLVTAIMALAVVAGVIWLVGVMNLSPFRAESSRATATSISQELGEISRLNVQLQLAAAETHVDGLSDRRQGVQGSYNTTTDLGVTVEYRTSGDTGYLTIQQGGANQDNSAALLGQEISTVMNLSLPADIPIELKVDMGAGEAVLDLSGLTIQSVSMAGGAGRLDVTLPAQGNFPVEVSAGVGEIIIRVPRSLEARLSGQVFLSSLGVPSRFENLGDRTWQTAGYASAANRAEITINQAVGSVEIVDS